MVLGTVAEFCVVTLAGRNTGMALSLDKARLAALPLSTAAASEKRTPRP
jgi:hypothetical protein